MEALSTHTPSTCILVAANQAGGGDVGTMVGRLSSPPRVPELPFFPRCPWIL